MSEWKEFQLGELYNVSSGLSKAADQFGFGNTFISFKDVFNSYFLPENPEGLVNSNEKEQISCSVKAGDILLTRTSETNDEVGMSSVALKDYEKSTFNGFCKRLRIKKDAPIKVSSLYIGYLLRTRFFRKTVANFATMTTRASLNSESIKSIPLLFPSFSIQEEIGKTLHSLDKKINLLKQQNQTLEELAQTLFKRWFVEFEFPNGNGKPYKSFGGEMVESELGEIPVGWKCKELQKLVTVKRGGSPRPIQDFLVKDGYPWVKISDATATDSPFLMSTKEFIKEEGLSKTVYLKKGSLILSNSATPGLPKFLELDACIHDGWLHFPRISVITQNYMYLLFLHLKKHIVQQGSGSVFTNLKTDILKEQLLPVAPANIVKSFDNLIDSYFNKIRNNTSEIQTLTQLRDTLLPKLMSRELKFEKLRI